MSNDDTESEFVWTPELIAEECARIDRGIAVMSVRMWNDSLKRWVLVK